MEITEKWLGEIGGWAAMKAARALVAAGAVSECNREGDMVRGTVGVGKSRHRAGLRIRSGSDVDNLCTCGAARQRGLICEHSLAVALASIRGGTTAAIAGAGGAPAHPSPEATGERSIQAMPVPAVPRGQFSVYLPDELLRGKAARSAAVFLRFEPGGDEIETALGSWLGQRGLRAQTTPLSLTADDLHSLLRALGCHPRVFPGRPRPGADLQTGDERISVASEPTRLPLRVREISATEVQVEIASDSIAPILVLRDRQGRVAETWWHCAATRSLVWLDKSMEAELSALQGELVDDARRSSSPRSLAWMVRHLGELERLFELELEGPRVSRLRVLPVPCEFALLVDGTPQAVEAELSARHGGRSWKVAPAAWTTGDPKLFPIEDPADPVVFFVRNQNREDAAMRTLEAAGFEAIAGGRWRITGADRVLRFYGSDLPRLESLMTVEQAARWRAATRGWLRIAPTVRAMDRQRPGAEFDRQASNDWLSLDISYEASSGFRVSRSDILQMIRSGRGSLQAKDGRRYVIDVEACNDFEESLQDIEVRLREGGADVPVAYASYLVSAEGFRDPAMAAPRPADWIRQQLGSLGRQLRDYQVAGVCWLEALARSGRAGLLADDMGLGKTIQCIALFRLLLDQRRATAEGPGLIVCPKSLITNWKEEFERFAPNLKVCVLVGPQRQSRFEVIAESDVILTTYQLIVRDLNVYRQCSFQVIALDEASYVRNPETEAAKALRQLPSTARLALTGTPIENSVRDLWSIYQFLLPGFLGSQEAFRSRFEAPLAVQAPISDREKAARRLKRLVAPYFFRRTKADVLPELPEKIEQTIWCELTDAQREVYKRLLEEGHDEVRRARRRLSATGVRLTMFTVLLRLRQVCCDLRLTGLPPDRLPRDSGEMSGKLSVWRDRLDEVGQKGDKMLVFSQFVGFLHLMRNYLETQNIQFAYLDGSTRDRSAAISTFQTQSSCGVFLISLKAGGYGLNLTAATHVILMDPWWNPAVEAQAVDRAHRIGQNRAVTALRLATRGTVEEKILALQSRKRGLVEAALTDDDSPQDFGGIGNGELEELVGV